MLFSQWVDYHFFNCNLEQLAFLLVYNKNDIINYVKGIYYKTLGIHRDEG